MFYVIKKRSFTAESYDKLGEFKTYDDALEYLKRNKQDVTPTFIFEVKAVANHESIFDYVSGSIYEY